MKRYKPSLRDFCIKHHTEKNALTIQIIRGKDHNHLEINEGGLERSFISNRFVELLDFAIELLKDYKKNRNVVYRHTKRRELE